MKSPTQSSSSLRSNIQTRSRLDIAPDTYLSFRISNALLSAVALLVSWVLFQSYTNDNAESGAWGCEMSWMTPSYQTIDWTDNSIPRYALRLYRELGWDDDKYLSGQPVIFVPGNAGSYQQVRSIASAAARQYFGKPGGRADGMEDIRNIDMFTVDLNEEFSAFHAATLREQAKFVESSIHKVLAQYHHLPAAERPAKVTLLGHSMGGIAARLAITPDTIDIVDMILTMSTPHVIPPLTLDIGMEKIYREIEDVATSTGQEYPILISLCGGVSDTQIVSDSCALPRSVTSPNGGFATFTTGMPHAWTGVDHQAMVWCHQIRWSVARTLLEMTRSRDRQHKRQAAEQWMLGNQSNFATSVASKNERLIPVISKNMTIVLKAGQGVLTSHQIQHCSLNGICQVQHPTQEYLPWPTNASAPFPLPGEGIKPNESVLALRLCLKSDGGNILLNSLSPLEILHGTRIEETVTGNVWGLLTKSCEGIPPIIKHTTIPSSGYEQSSNEARFFPDGRRVIRIHSHISSSPFISGQTDGTGVRLEVFQSSSCPVVRVKLSIDLWGSLAKTVTRYRMTIVAWTIGWTAIIILKQMTILSESDRLISFGASIDEVARTWSIKCFALLGAAALIQKAISWIPGSSTLLIGAVDLVYLPVIALFAVWGFGLVCILWNVTCLGLWTGKQISSSCCRIPPLSSVSAHNPRDSPRLISLVPAITAILLVYFLVPDQLAFMIAVGVIWASSAYLSHDRASGTLHNEKRHLATSALFMMLLMTPYNVPTLFVWARSLWFKWEHAFATDHNPLSVLPAIMVACMSVPQEGARPNGRKLPIQICRACLVVLAMVSFLLGSRWTWLLFPICNTVLACIVAIIW
ncbi:hypothetical protein IAT40_000430 [Kwoniella sp. CBS 6097]